MLNTLLLCQGTTVFRATWNFEPSRGICAFPRNIRCFHRILWHSVPDGDMGTNTAFWSGSSGGRKLVTVDNGHNFATKYTTATQTVTGGIFLKYSPEFTGNIASLFGRQTVSVSCSASDKKLHIWSGSAAVENYVQNVQNLLWKTLVPDYDY